MTKAHRDKVLLFDDVCLLCSRTVSRVSRWDKKGEIYFAPLNGDYARELRQQYAIPDNYDSMLYLSQEKLHSHGDAVLMLCGDLGGVATLVKIGWVLPKPIRDILYKWIAKNRYSWFGKAEKSICENLPQDVRGRILG